MLKPRWSKCVVAASGPSLTPDVAFAVCLSDWPTIAIQDAYRLMPWADVLYGCDAKWWSTHNGCMDFEGEKWSAHDDGTNAKLAEAEKYGLNLVAGQDKPGFSLDPEIIHYGSNSGFQALNFAILWGATEIALVGFDMRRVEGKAHFFGEHPEPLRNGAKYERFVEYFTRAKVPEGVRILNATPGSALQCYPFVDMGEIFCA